MKINNVHEDIEEFIGNLESQTQSEVLRIIDLLGIEGYNIRMPYSKKIEKDLYELRIKSVQNIRVFYTFCNNGAYLLNVIIKQKQRLSEKDLKTARARLKWLH